MKDLSNIRKTPRAALLYFNAWLGVLLFLAPFGNFLNMAP